MVSLPDTLVLTSNKNPGEMPSGLPPDLIMWVGENPHPLIGNFVRSSKALTASPGIKVVFNTS